MLLYATNFSECILWRRLFWLWSVRRASSVFLLPLFGSCCWLSPGSSALNELKSEQRLNLWTAAKWRGGDGSWEGVPQYSDTPIPRYPDSPMWTTMRSHVNILRWLARKGPEFICNIISINAACAIKMLRPMAWPSPPGWVSSLPCAG